MTERDNVHHAIPQSLNTPGVAFARNVAVQLSACRTWTPVLILMLFGILSGCNATDESKSSPPNLPPPLVKVAQPLQQTVTEWDEFTGRIEAINTVDVRARVSGYLEKVYFTAGQRVKKGDLLFQIDPKPLQAQLDLATAELEQAKTKRLLAQNEFARAQNLLKANAIAVEEYDQRNKGFLEASAAVKAADASVAIAKLNLDYAQIRSPIDGRVGREMVNIGNLVSSGGDAGILTTLVSNDPVYVYVEADERSVLKYKRQHPKGIVGKPMLLSVSDETDFSHPGKIDYLSPHANPATGTITLRGVFANPSELLAPGFFARVKLQASTPYEALLLPDRAISTDQTQRFVWVLLKNNQVDYRPLVLGAQIGNMRVVNRGLTKDDVVITDGLPKIKPGITVKPERISLDQE